MALDAPHMEFTLNLQVLNRLLNWEINWIIENRKDKIMGNLKVKVGIGNAFFQCFSTHLRTFKWEKISIMQGLRSIEEI